jgi:hypothetical protein
MISESEQKKKETSLERKFRCKAVRPPDVKYDEAGAISLKLLI